MELINIQRSSILFWVFKNIFLANTIRWPDIKICTCYKPLKAAITIFRKTVTCHQALPLCLTCLCATYQGTQTLTYETTGCKYKPVCYLSPSPASVSDMSGCHIPGDTNTDIWNSRKKQDINDEWISKFSLQEIRFTRSLFASPVCSQSQHCVRCWSYGWGHTWQDQRPCRVQEYPRNSLWHFSQFYGGITAPKIHPSPKNCSATHKRYVELLLLLQLNILS